MAQVSHETVLSNVRIWSHGISLWTGRKKLNIADLKVGKEDLPPEDLASLGSKKIIDPKRLNVFTMLKARMISLFEDHGVKFLGGYAIAEDKTDEVLAKVREIVEEGVREKALFLAEYDARVQSWIDEHPNWSDVIRSSITPKSVVDERIHFSFNSFKIVTPSGDEASKPENSGVVESSKGLADALISEIADDASDYFEKSLLGKEVLRQSALSPIKRFRTKLAGFSFIDPVVNPIVESIDTVLKKMPSEGPILGADLSALHGLVFILSDEDRMLRHGKAILDGTSIDDALDSAEPEPEVEEEVAVLEEASPDVSVQETQDEPTPAPVTSTAPAPEQAVPPSSRFGRMKIAA